MNTLPRQLFTGFLVILLIILAAPSFWGFSLEEIYLAACCLFWVLTFYFAGIRWLLVAILGMSANAILTIALLIPYDVNFYYGSHFPIYVHTPANEAEVISSLSLGLVGYWFIALYLAGRTAPTPRRTLFSNHVMEIKHPQSKFRIAALLGALYMLFSADGWIIFDSYPLNKAQSPLYISALGGSSVIGSFAILASVYIARVSRLRNEALLGNLLAGGVMAQYLLAGDRGGFSVVLIGLVGIYLLTTPKVSWRHLLVILVLTYPLVMFLSHWGFVRSQAAELGFFTALFSSDGGGGDIVSIADITLLPASYGHYLHVVDLYAGGIRLNGETVYALIPQTLPSFVAGWLDYERPLNSAWQLAMYRRHGGGMFIYAEAYWNFGYYGPLMLGISLAFVFGALERYFSQTTKTDRIIYFGLLGGLLFSTYYGLLPFVRVLQVALAYLLIGKWLRDRSRRRGMRQRASLPPAVPSGHHRGFRSRG